MEKLSKLAKQQEPNEIEPENQRLCESYEARPFTPVLSIINVCRRSKPATADSEVARSNFHGPLLGPRLKQFNSGDAVSGAETPRPVAVACLRSEYPSLSVALERWALVWFVC
jgi:hypothetical protein